MKYMGDYPIKHARSPIELTDQIFGSATQHRALQDEIYCQIMRQMTSNNNRCSFSVSVLLYLKEFTLNQEATYPILYDFPPFSCSSSLSGWVWSVGGSWCGCAQACSRLVTIWWDTLSASWSRGPEISCLLAACRGCTGCSGQSGVINRNEE